MIKHFRLLRNIGQFDSVDAGAAIELGGLVLIYAENGRGKTTLAAVLRSLATGDPLPISERHRFGAAHPPHVVVDCDGNMPRAMFQNHAWDHTLPQLAVFDDVFIDENVCSGLAIEVKHRQNLHELVLGAPGVALSKRLQASVSKIEEHNRALREKVGSIPDTVRQGFNVDAFCDLPEFANIDIEVEATQRALAAARERDAVASTPLFESFFLPSFDTEAIDRVLGRGLPELDAEAEATVRAHFDTLGSDGEQWVSEGMQFLTLLPNQESCPFCAQALAHSSLLAHYRAYFSAGYKTHKRTMADALATVRREHSGDIMAAFERSVRVAGERRQFWSRFCDIPEVLIDTAAVARDWNAARGGVLKALTVKLSAPLESQELSGDVRNAIVRHEAQRQRIAALSATLGAANQHVQVAQEQAAGADPKLVATDLARLRATKVRYSPDIAPLCDAYLAEKADKTRTEAERNAAKADMDEYRNNVFPRSQTAINVYLRRFNAGFRLDSVQSAIRRGGAVCTYSVVINDTAVPIADGSTRQGEASFRSTLSSGDRNTLALAFFFASLDQGSDLDNKIVVIDDPISSLDDHRALTTVQEIRRLAGLAGQLIVLSHDKRFLCRVWQGATQPVALEIVRDGEGSTLRSWNVRKDSITEHDRRDSQLRSYVARGDGDQREVARSLRPHLEAFLRVARPKNFPPGTLLGPFLNLCKQSVGRPQEILDGTTTDELARLVEYANRFHHDTNPAWETEVINDTELRNFVEGVLAFARG